MTHDYKIICARYNEDIRWILPFIKSSIIFNKGVDDLTYIPNEHIIKCSNVGREGGTYLKFIIDNYEELPSYMLFIQGHPFDHIYVNDKNRGIQEIQNIIQSNNSYFKYLSKHHIFLKKSELTNYRSGIPVLYNEQIRLTIHTKKLLDIIDTFNVVSKSVMDLKEKIININKDELFIFEFMEIVNSDGYFNTDIHGQKQKDVILQHFHDDILEKIVDYKYYFGYGALFWVHKNRILKYPKSYWVTLHKGFDVEKPGAGWGLEKSWNLILNDYYERVQWIYSFQTLTKPPIMELIDTGYIVRNSKHCILFITKEINDKFFAYSKINKKIRVFSKKGSKNKTKNLFVKYFKPSLITYFSKSKEQKEQVDLVYINNLTYMEIVNSFEILLKNCSSFYVIIDNIINTDGFYLDNTPLAYLYSYQKENTRCKILGIYEKMILVQIQ